MLKVIQAGEARKVAAVALRPLPGTSAIGHPAAVPARTPHDPRPGLGDRLEKLVKPAAKLLQRVGVIDCLDPVNRHRVRPNTPCAKRIAALNKAGQKLGLR